MNQSRREFMLEAPATLAVGRVTLVTGATALAFKPNRAEAAWLQVAMLAISAVSAFTKKGDGGLSAILGAVNSKLDLVLDQLVTVQHSIESVMADVDALKDLITENNQDAKAHPYVVGIHSAIIQYSTFFKAFRYPERMREARNRPRLEAIYSQVAEQSSSLESPVVPQLPLVAATVPVALGLEVLLMNLLDMDRAFVEETKNRYRAWIDALLDPEGPRSVHIHLNRYVADLDATWQEMRTHSEVVLSGYDYKNQQDNEAIAIMCHIMREENAKRCVRTETKNVGNVRENGVDKEVCVEYTVDRGPKTMLIDRFWFSHQADSGVILDALRYDRRIETDPSPQLAMLTPGVRTMRTEVELRPADPANQSGACTTSTHEIAGSNEIRRERIEQQEGPKSFRQHYLALDGKIAKANALRYKIAVAMSAVSALYSARNQLDG